LRKLFLRKTFFNEHTGHAKVAGEMYTLPELAKTMKVIVEEGEDALYNGSLTKILLEDLRTVNGIITEEDLANYK